MRHALERERIASGEQAVETLVDER